MAGLTHNVKFPCGFELRFLEWERYNSDSEAFSGKMVELGEPYTLWVKYHMALQIGDRILYQSNKETTLILEDIKRLIKELRQLTNDKRDRLAFDPIEPDFGLVIRNLTESDTTVMISSAAEIRAEMPTGATNQSTDSTRLFDVNVWIDYPNQVDRVYGGYGPGLYFYVEGREIEQFAEQLQTELEELGPYSPTDEENAI